MENEDKHGNFADHDANVVHLNTEPTDAQLAEYYQKEIKARLQAVCDIITQANRNKIEVQFQLGPDGFGRSTVQAIKISKVLLP